LKYIPRSYYITYFRGALMKSSQIRKQEKVTYLPGVKHPVKKRRPRLVYCLIIIVILYFSLLFISQYRSLYQFKRTLHEIEEQITLVQAQNERMQQEIEQLYTHSYLEKMARQDLGMVRPGELLFFFQKEDRQRE
jgi:cell division protein DivIC